ncbi:MAG TPA: ubiquinol-cytochrome c reductase cytochrome b subunit, partial [Actinomycetota bacterium]|nr:ubiquinol-cytochrome c reductase cytochrome b subunit [Actinomycetota bacterium]
AFMGGLFQINPVWDFGPFDATTVSAASQPDWYVGWLEGALRLFPPADVEVFGVLIPSPFVPGVVIPGLGFTVLALWPFIEARITGDRAEHHLLDRPRDAPLRTAVGVAGLLYFGILTIAGGNDVLSLLFNVPVETMTVMLRYATFVVPILGGLVAYRIAKDLRDSGTHPFRRGGGVRLRRTSSGGFEEAADRGWNRPPPGG